MQLPGLVTVSSDDEATLEHLANMMGESFLEEMWFDTWLAALDDLGAGRERKLAIMQAYFLDELSVLSQYGAVYALEDLTAATGGYLASELGQAGQAHLETMRYERMESLLTEEERRLLDEREQAMYAISDFDWHRAWPREGDDYIYFSSWAVDKNARGTHALSRLLAPILAFADAKGLDCYLECYADRLQSMYEHFGFRVVRELHDDGFPVYERCMVRSAQR
ncbi:MAG TPA: GNAT family N-acetyltransferase [Slackia equolifaciens]|uniref:GNAT family N-acetyltransferase n=1 Tax=Slackia equolifaciens TaxID=498718 RepID=A0A9D2UUQ4_9ACTN|nr:GNAT family N-acetyltransferase [Slackia equolifaciens]